MKKREIQTVTESWLSRDQLADDPVIAVDLTERILQAAENDRIVCLVVATEQLETDSIEKAEPQETRIAASFVRDFEVMLLVLYAAYALAVLGATAFVLLELGHVL
ncbi:hypothetical protein NKI01_26135 [Mesorhizobium sp. M0815]|uniref:hypothetical protein n=1 Tax=unclassified Mesorhizobium TaxID=325217 RepID=UPI0033373CB7